MENNNPQISIIVPVYNVKEYLIQLTKKEYQNTYIESRINDNSNFNDLT